jgi:2-polyprenyl-3-methyl-5-hydroxy-6-metoxy-1,4-benzoquinol methylase
VYYDRLGASGARSGSAMRKSHAGTGNPPLTDEDSHFAFGENWASFARLIDDEVIAASQRNMAALLGGSDLRERTFLDLGCGSGLHALAALRLGAAHVTAVDIDANSVATTRSVLGRLAPSSNWTVNRYDILEATPGALGEYDIVYSWGVLHHTGAMHEALGRAAALVKVGGVLAVALYRATPLCAVWRVIKRRYSRAGRSGQVRARAVYVALFRLALLARGRSFRAYIRDYKQRRGMDFYHDAHDWLGGYPYESVAPYELRDLLTKCGLREVRSFTKPVAAFGLLGSGCDEYLFEKRRK